MICTINALQCTSHARLRPCHTRSGFSCLEEHVWLGCAGGEVGGLGGAQPMGGRQVKMGLWW